MAAPASANKGIPILTTSRVRRQLQSKASSAQPFFGTPGSMAASPSLYKVAISGSFESGGVTDSNPMAAW